MKPVVRVLQTTLVDMRVDLGRRDIDVPEHLLDDAQVTAVFQQVRGEAVPQCVRRDVLGDAGGVGVLLDEIPDRLRTERRAARREKYFAVQVTVAAKRR